MRRNWQENPVRRIVSFRVSDEEYRKLSRMRRASGMSFSAMLRDLFTQMENPYKNIRQR